MNDYRRFRILVDLPAAHPGLGFDETARGLAGLIRNSEPQFAIAVYGQWGSGKTTLMQAIERRLSGERIIAVGFSAWRYEKEEHLIVPLLDTVRAALMAWSRRMSALAEQGGAAGETRRRRSGEVARDTARTLGRVMASMLAGLSFRVGLPGALDLSFDANRALARGESEAPAAPDATSRERFLGRLSDPDLPQSFYHACFEALRDAFATFERATGGARIVVFVDDLDRCLPAGTLQVLESMKLFFDLRGFVFVVGLDRDVVERSIDQRYLAADGDGTASAGGTTQGTRLVRGSDYLKKIFQVPYTLAPVSVGLMDDLFAALQRDARLPAAQLDDLREVVRPHLAYLFTGARLNPREVKRYINAYTIQMQVKPALDPHVVLALNTLFFRRDCARLYEALATFRLETSLALRRYFDGDRAPLGEVELDPADVPVDIRVYLGPGSVAAALLDVTDLDTYLDAGEATRSGEYFLSSLEEYGRLRSALRDAIDSRETLAFDAAWSAANSHFGNLVSHLAATEGEPEAAHPELRAFATWLDAATPGTAWQRLLEQMNEDQPLDTLREQVHAEAREHLAAVRALLRQQRRQAVLEA